MASVRQIPNLTAARGIAAWWVVLYHFRGQMGWAGSWTVQFLSKGYLAVDFFFVLSGFVIALNYFDTFTSLDIGTTRRFLWLRLARVYPLHIFVLVIYVSVPIAILLFSKTHHVPDQEFGLWYYLASVLMIQNWAIFDHLAWNVPAWSISTEWFAYLLFPLMCGAIRKWLHTPLRLGVAIALLPVLLACVTAQSGSLGKDISSLGLVRCVLEFNAGCCLYCFWRASPTIVERIGFAGAAICFGSYVMFQVPDYLAVPLGCVFLIGALVDSRGWFGRKLSNRLLVYAGTVSYSTYLVHYLLREWIKLLLVGHGIPAVFVSLTYIAAVGTASVLLYRLVEEPGRIFLRTQMPGSPAPNAQGSPSH